MTLRKVQSEGAMRRAHSEEAGPKSNRRWQDATSVEDLQSLRQERPERRVLRLGDVVVSAGPNRTESAESTQSEQQSVFVTLAGFCPVTVPFLKWMPTYQWKEDFQADFVGGATIALICVVQTLAHASIATTEVIQGPYCAFVPPFVYGLLGTSPHASVSSGAIAAILIADQLKFSDDVRERTQLATMLSLLSGVILMIMGLCKAAFAVRFLSQSTLSGFVTGGAIIIIEGQLKNLLGLTMRHTNGFKDTAVAIWHHVPQTNVVSFALGLSVLMSLQVMMKLKKYCQKVKARPKPHPWWLRPALVLTEMKELVLVALGIVFAYVSGMEEAQMVGPIPAGLPHFEMPWELPANQRLIAGELSKSFHHFCVGSTFVALSSFLTTYATCKRQALVHNYHLDGAQEMFALGAAGVCGSFYGSFAPSGSLSRASLAAELGVRTNMNGFMMVVVTGLCLIYLTPVIYFLPRSVLGAIIIRAAWNLVDTATFRVLWTAWKPYRLGGQRRDMIVWLAALSLTVACGVMYGIMGAVAISVAMLVKDSAMPRVVTLCQLESQYGAWRDAEVFHEGLTFPGVLVMELRGPMTFASADHFQEELENTREVYNETSNDELRVIVLSFASVHDMDPTALSMLRDLLSAWRKLGISCIVAEAKARVRLLIEENFGDFAHCPKGQQPLLKQSRFIVTIDAAVNEAMRSKTFNPGAELSNGRRNSVTPTARISHMSRESKGSNNSFGSIDAEDTPSGRPHSLSDMGAAPIATVPPSPPLYDRNQLQEPLLGRAAYV